MTSSVLPPFSSKITVVTAPSSLSSFVQTRRECGVTSMYRPKNAIGFEPSWPNSKRYLPPTRTSASQESRDTPVDFGAHHRSSSSGLVHASNTMRAGPLKVRVTTSSRSDFRSTVVRFFMGAGAARKLKRAQILLAADAGASDEAIASVLRVSGSTVYRTKRRFVEGNLELALSEEPRPWGGAQTVGQGDGAAGGDRLLKPAAGSQALDVGTAGRCDGQADGP